MRPTRSNAALTLAAALVLLAAGARAATTKSFRQATAKDFEEGEATASMILPDGTVVPGMKTAPVSVDAAFVWCSVLSPDGKTAYFGTGDQGRIYATDVTGGEAHARKVAQLDAAWVTSLVARPDGTLVAGTTPGGKLYSVDPKKGEARPFATLGTDHVWALALDAKTGVVYVGTGGPGKIFAVDRSGRSKELWDSGDKHVVSLLQADDKHLYAGTSEEAIVFRIGLDGRAEALGDFDAEEVRALARVGSAVYVAVNDFERAGATAPALPVAAHGTRITVSPTGSPASAGALPRPGQRKSKAALYRLDRDGRIEQIFSVGDGYFTALSVDADGRVYVGTGTEGRVYRVDPDRQASLAIDLPERQALTLLRSGKTFLVGTGDVGGIYRVAPAPARQASYLSRVLDGEFHARWGLLRWHGTHELGLETRSGNTAKPDTTWSAFAGLDHPRATGDGGVGLVKSPGARYVQYRVTFGAPDARVEQVTLAYLPQNQRARVTEITVGDSGAAPVLSTGGALGGLGGGVSVTPATARGSTPRRSSCAGRSTTPTATSSSTGSPSARRTTPSGVRSAARTRSPRPTSTGTPRGSPTGRTSSAWSPATSAPSRASACWRRASRRRRSWSTTASPRWPGWWPSILSSRDARATTRARSPAWSTPSTAATGRSCRPPTASPTTWSRPSRSSSRRCRPARTTSPCAPGTAPTTWAPQR